ncbi:hypothetical protein AA919_004244 [Escherichia coli]|nr:hypothetical protein [Escherichia coli]
MSKSTCKDQATMAWKKYATGKATKLLENVPMGAKASALYLLGYVRAGAMVGLLAGIFIGFYWIK